MVKTFTIQEANKALILVKPIVEDLREEVELLTLLQSRGSYPTETESKIHIERLKHHFEELKQVGCFSKEPHEGLVDFPSFYGDTPVFLCWQMGEESLLHWHSIHEDHSRRQIIDEQFLSENSKTAPAIA